MASIENQEKNQVHIRHIKLPITFLNLHRSRCRRRHTISQENVFLFLISSDDGCLVLECLSSESNEKTSSLSSLLTGVLVMQNFAFFLHLQFLFYGIWFRHVHVQCQSYCIRDEFEYDTRSVMYLFLLFVYKILYCIDICVRKYHSILHKFFM